MRINRKKLLLAALVSFLVTGCGARERNDSPALLQTEEEVDESLIAVGFSQVGAESDWRAANTESIRSALTAENGFYLIYEDAQQKPENQLKAVRSFILQEVDFIALSPIVETGWESVLQEAKDEGIPVILVDRMAQVPDSLFTCWLGSNFEQEGETAARWLADYLKSTGRDEEPVNIVTLQGTLGSTAQIGRTEGFAKVMSEHPNWRMLEMQDADFTQARGREVMEDLLSKYEDIDVVVCENDNMAFGAVDAIKSAGKTCGPEGEITILSFDAVKAALEAMIEGEINADFECNPLHGPKLAEILHTLSSGGSVERIQYMEETYFDTGMDLESLLAKRAY